MTFKQIIIMQLLVVFFTLIFAVAFGAPNKKPAPFKKGKHGTWVEQYDDRYVLMYGKCIGHNDTAYYMRTTDGWRMSIRHDRVQFTK